MKYVLTTLGKVQEGQLCSVDPDFTVASIAGLIAAHNAGALNLEDEVEFCDPYWYQFAPDNAPCILKVED